jgi:hypothetical protein
MFEPKATAPHLDSTHTLRHRPTLSAGLKRVPICGKAHSGMSPPVHAGGLQRLSSSIGWDGFPIHAADFIALVAPICVSIVSKSK